MSCRLIAGARDPVNGGVSRGPEGGRRGLGNPQEWGVLCVCVCVHVCMWRVGLAVCLGGHVSDSEQGGGSWRELALVPTSLCGDRSDQKKAPSLHSALTVGPDPGPGQRSGDSSRVSPLPTRLGPNLSRKQATLGAGPWLGGARGKGRWELNRWRAAGRLPEAAPPPSSRGFLRRRGGLFRTCLARWPCAPGPPPADRLPGATAWRRKHRPGAD